MDSKNLNLLEVRVEETDILVRIVVIIRAVLVNTNLSMLMTLWFRIQQMNICLVSETYNNRRSLKRIVAT